MCSEAGDGGWSLIICRRGTACWWRCPRLRELATVTAGSRGAGPLTSGRVARQRRQSDRGFVSVRCHDTVTFRNRSDTVAEHCRHLTAHDAGPGAVGGGQLPRLHPHCVLCSAATVGTGRPACQCSHRRHRSDRPRSRTPCRQHTVWHFLRGGRISRTAQTNLHQNAARTL